MKIILVRSRAIDSAVFKVAETLHDNGFNVHLLVWDRQHNLDDNSYPYKITKFKVKTSHDNGFVLFYLHLWWIYEILFLLKIDAEIIHACDLDTLWAAIIVKFIKKNKINYTIYDFYANHLSYKPPYFLTGTIRKLVTSIELFGIKFTDILFLTDENRYDEVKDAKINKVEYIYNSPLDYLNIKEKGKINADRELNIFYGGGIFEYRGIEYMIKAINDLDKVKLTIAGTGSDDLVKKIKKYSKNSEKIDYLGWLPSYEDILKETLKSDVIFRFADPKVPRTKYDNPNKVFEAMMCKKPIIINSELGISKIIQEENCGIMLHYGDVDAIKKAINKLKDPYIREELGINGRKAYDEKYSWKIMTKRLLNNYNQYSSQEVN